jgi:spectinomycin phosphotransferase
LDFVFCRSLRNQFAKAVFICMLEAPDLDLDRVRTELRTAYGIDAAVIEFLPLGNDRRSFSYRTVTTTGQRYFLKLRTEPPDQATLAVPRLLHDAGITNVVAPIPTDTGALAAPFGDYSLLLYPFIGGDSGMARGLTAAQWREHGRVLRCVHDAVLPADVLRMLPLETYVPASLGYLRELHSRVLANSPGRIETKVVSEFWRANSIQIEAIMARAEALGAQFAARAAPSVLCHADIHTANLMIDDSGGLHYVDWDGPMLAPRERDLKFMLSSSNGDPVSDAQQHAFLAGYGPVAPDPGGLDYYRNEWVVEDLADYGFRLFDGPVMSEQTHAETFRELQRMFEPGDVVAAAASA